MFRQNKVWTSACFGTSARLAQTQIVHDTERYDNDMRMGCLVAVQPSRKRTEDSCEYATQLRMNAPNFREEKRREIGDSRHDTRGRMLWAL
jgi:hypothetical protein